MTIDSKTKAPCCAPGCCSPAAKEAPAAAAAPDVVRERVREGYAAIAKAGGWSQAQGACGSGAGGCCGSTSFTPEGLAAALGYTPGELAGLPTEANMGLSCGNPAALAGLRAGEVVLDLGSGGGFDCFVAGPRVGASGRVIGVDMTPEMVSKARANTPSYRSQTGLDNVEFRLGEIENLPVADASVDVVISNCVLNLSPDKARVWREMARVLRPGGRVAVSDVVLLRALPAGVREDVEALVGCIAGAAQVGEVERFARDAGLTVRVTVKRDYIAAMLDANDPLFMSIAARLPAGAALGDFVASANIEARKG